VIRPGEMGSHGQGVVHYLTKGKGTLCECDPGGGRIDCGKKLQSGGENGLQTSVGCRKRWEWNKRSFGADYHPAFRTPPEVRTQFSGVFCKGMSGTNSLMFEKKKAALALEEKNRGVHRTALLSGGLFLGSYVLTREEHI